MSHLEKAKSHLKAADSQLYPPSRMIVWALDEVIRYLESRGNHEPTEEQWAAYVAALLDHQEDIAHTANVLRDHFLEYTTCRCGKQIQTVSEWAMHVTKILHP